MNNPLRDGDTFGQRRVPHDDDSCDIDRHYPSALCGRNLIAGVTVFAVLLVIVWLLIAPGCAESGIQKQIDALTAEAMTAEAAGDLPRAAELREYAAALEPERVAAREQDDMTWGTAGALGGLVGGPLIGTLFARIRSATVRRRAVTAVVSAIEAGKKASPELAELFKGGAAHDAIKAAMPEDVKAIVAEARA